VALVAVATMLTFFSRQMGLRVRRNFDKNLERTVAARDGALQGYAEQMRDLHALSGEIAHELKNPLASIKGLAALVARELQGKPAERMAVLRGEVDRMAGILEELLTFSRPLVPLSLEEVDLAALTREVVDLHEGMAGDRRLALRLSGGPAA